ncbi:MAG: DUF4366 domain-containing protein [Dialister sp.]|nr:DUF4366 domain-containing protein [Dialister sp.]
MNKVKNWSEKISLRKKWLLFVLALLIGTGAVIGVKPFGTMAMAETFATSEKETYYYVSFQSQTADGHYADLGFTVPFSIHFGNKLTNSDTKKEVASWDETVLSSEMKKVGDMAYLTTKGYKLYARDVVQKLEPSVYYYANLSSAPENADYYLGYSTLGQRTIRQDGQDLDCYTLSYPILKLNRNVQKVKVDYEGALTEETKKVIQENVLAANPNMPMRRVVSMTDQTLSISNIGRDDALTFKVEDLIIRVKSEGTSTSESATSEPTTSEPATSETPSESTTTPDTKSEEKPTESTKPTEPAPTEKPADDTKIEKLTKERDELQKTIDELKKELDGKNTLNAEQEKKLNDLTGKVDTLQKTLEEAKKACEAKTDSKEKEALTSALDALSKSIDGLEKNISQLNAQKDKVTTTQPSAMTKTPTVNQTPLTTPSASGNTSSKVAQTGGSASTQGMSSTTPTKTEMMTSSTASANETNTSTTENKQEAVIRYPNKLTPKTPANLANSSSGTSSNQPQVTTKGVASDPSKARGTVTENVDNGNKDYPIHHGDGTDAQAVASDGNAVLREQYSADARQFVTFTTKSGKTFHLIINHDEDSENVLLLTEVDEDDLLNMVEKKEEPKVVKEELVQKVEETQPVKKEEPQPKSNLGTILLMILVASGVAGAGYYFKVVKAKEKKELEELEEPEDDYYSEAEEPDAESESEEPKENEELL